MKVSVIIPFYNAFSFLEKSVSSALNQDETGELILIDDHSTDNSLDLVKKLQQKDDRIIIFQNNSNISGAAISRNVGVHHAVMNISHFWMLMIIICRNDLRLMFFCF